MFKESYITVLRVFPNKKLKVLRALHGNEFAHSFMFITVFYIIALTNKAWAKYYFVVNPFVVC